MNKKHDDADEEYEDDGFTIMVRESICQPTHCNSKPANANHDTPTNVFHLWRFLHIIQKTINSFYAINTSTCQKKAYVPVKMQ